MFKKRLFGYSKKQVDMLQRQIESDHMDEKEILMERINKLEIECGFFKNENEADKVKIYEAKNNYRSFMKTVANMLTRK